MDEDMARKELDIAQDEATDKKLVVLPPGAVLPRQPMRYVGAGEYIYGVPARDLTAAETSLYAAQIAATATATGRVLYAPVEGEE